MTTEKTLLFVYGTLKRGLRNHRLLADQEFLGEAVTEPRYRVVDLGPHPGLISDGVAGLAVKGELWAVSPCCLAELDDFEEVPGPFVRDPVAVAGRAGVVFAYFLNTPVPPGAATGAEWPLP
jgi:gamma-glutamylaminecyclotransferase